MKIAAVVLAAGRGMRLRSKTNKPYLLLNGKPILLYSLEKFDACPQINTIVAVVNEDDVGFLKSEILDKHSFRKEIKLAVGGAHRQDSARAGVRALEADLILIHDGVRPFFSLELVNKLIEAAKQHGAAVPAIKVKDTVRQLDRDGQLEAEFDRERLVLIQTPQCFSYSLLRYALDEATKRLAYFTDEAGAVWAISNIKPVLIEGEEQNIKITTAFDLKLAELIARELLQS